jgi:hypothetical protein
LTFGTSIPLSRLITAAQSVPGVQNVAVTALQRLDDGKNLVSAEILTFGPHEIPQLDDDPNFPERGQLQLTIGGGR